MKTLLILRESNTGRWIDSKFIQVNDTNKTKLKNLARKNGYTTSVMCDTNTGISTYSKKFFNSQVERLVF